LEVRVILLDRRLGLIGLRTRAFMLAGLVAAASMVALAGSAEAQVGRGHSYGYGFGRGHGFAAPGRFGFGWYGGWPFYGWRYAPYGYARYYYPPYFYPAYMVPAAVFVVPPRVAAAPREFTVYFRFDRYNLTAEARQVVDHAIAVARSGGPARIVVTGNTDLAGTSRHNLVLSRERADAVRRYMMRRGIDPREISVRALGKTNPAIETADGVREPRNRRVEIVIIPLRRAPPATSMMAVPPYGRALAPANVPVGAPMPLTSQ
jgi:OmpA family